jgi:hypothetical protein
MLVAMLCRWQTAAALTPDCSASITIASLSTSVKLRRFEQPSRVGSAGASPVDRDLAVVELRTSWMSVMVRSGDGDAASFVQVAIFGDAAVALGRIEKNEKLYAEGSIRISEWIAGSNPNVGSGCGIGGGDRQVVDRRTCRRSAKERRDVETEPRSNH